MADVANTLGTQDPAQPSVPGETTTPPPTPAGKLPTADEAFGPTPAALPTADDAFGPAEAPTQPSDNQSLWFNTTPAKKVLDAFTGGFNIATDGYKDLGVSDATVSAFKKYEDATTPGGIWAPLHAFNETILRASSVAADAVMRTGMGVAAGAISAEMQPWDAVLHPNQSEGMTAGDRLRDALALAQTAGLLASTIDPSVVPKDVAAPPLPQRRLQVLDTIPLKSGALLDVKATLNQRDPSGAAYLAYAQDSDFIARNKNLSVEEEAAAHQMNIRKHMELALPKPPLPEAPGAAVAKTPEDAQYELNEKLREELANPQPRETPLPQLNLWDAPPGEALPAPGSDGGENAAYNRWAAGLQEMRGGLRGDLQQRQAIADRLRLHVVDELPMRDGSSVDVKATLMQRDPTGKLYARYAQASDAILRGSQSDEAKQNALAQNALSHMEQGAPRGEGGSIPIPPGAEEHQQAINEKLRDELQNPQPREFPAPSAKLWDAPPQAGIEGQSEVEPGRINPRIDASPGVTNEMVQAEYERFAGPAPDRVAPQRIAPPSPFKPPEPAKIAEGEATRVTSAEGAPILPAIETGADVQQHVADVAARAGFTDITANTARDVLSIPKQQELADALGLQASTFKPGLPNGVPVEIYTRAVTDLANKQAQAVREAAALPRTPENALKYLTEKARAQVINDEVTGLDKTAGRALPALKKEDSATVARAKQAEFLRTQATGEQTMGAIKHVDELQEPVEGAPPPTPEDELSAFIRDHRGANSDEAIYAEMDAVSKLPTPEAVAKVQADLRKPGALDKFLYVWTNGLLSGPFTHLRYMMGNAVFSLLNGLVVPPLAATIGAGRQLTRQLIGIGSATDRVQFGETMMHAFGMAQGSVEGLIAGYKAMRDNIPLQLPGRTLRLDKDGNWVKNEFTQQPQVMPLGEKVFGALGIPGAADVAGKIAGLPQRSIGGIHSFYQALNARVKINGLAWRQATAEKLEGSDFYSRVAELAHNPTEEMLTAASDYAGYNTFTQKGGKLTQAIQGATEKFKPLKLIAPFPQTPGNIFKAALEYTPLSPFLDADARANLLGQKGGAAQDTQIAKIMLGSALGVAVAHVLAQGDITGGGPTNPAERAAWLRTHQPYSFKILGGWHDYRSILGPLGIHVGTAADLAEAWQVGNVNDDWHQAAGMLGMSAARMVDDSSMGTLTDLLDALHSENKAETFLGRQASTLVPFSSLVRQSEAMADPLARQARTFTDALKLGSGIGRQSLIPPVDAWGREAQNRSAGAGSLLPTTPVQTDPVYVGANQAQFYPAPLSRTDEKTGQVLNDQQYHDLSMQAGGLAYVQARQFITSPTWANTPMGEQQQLLRTIVKHAREAARQNFQINDFIQANTPRPEDPANPTSLILKGLATKAQEITGTGPSKALPN